MKPAGKAILIGIAVALVLYKFVMTYTPVWVDLLVWAGAGLAILISAGGAKRNAVKPEETSAEKTVSSE